jgi:hypothetical protein
MVALLRYPLTVIRGEAHASDAQSDEEWRRCMLRTRSGVRRSIRTAPPVTLNVPADRRP